MDNKNNLIKRMCIGLGLLLLFGLGLYFYRFHGSLERDSKSWADFATYLSLFVNVASLILLGIISFMTFNTTHAFNNSQTTPILDFTVKVASEFSDDVRDCWYLINCSNAAARNISIRFWYGFSEPTKWVACYSLSGNSELELPWLKFAYKIQVYYTNAFETNYYCMEYVKLSGRVTEIDKLTFTNVVSSNERLNHGSLVLTYMGFCVAKKAKLVPIFSSSNDYVNDFAVTAQLIPKK